MRDYTLHCPERWIDSGDGKFCLPEDGYKVDGCNKPQELGTMTVAEKREFSMTCDSKWPCYNTCVEDYSKPCPLGWVLGSDGLCTAPTTYSGECVPMYDFKQHGSYLRYKWSRICDVVWPCRQVGAMGGTGTNELRLRAPLTPGMEAIRIDLPIVS